MADELPVFVSSISEKNNFSMVFEISYSLVFFLQWAIRGGSALKGDLF